MVLVRRSQLAGGLMIVVAALMGSCGRTQSLTSEKPLLPPETRQAETAEPVRTPPEPSQKTPPPELEPVAKPYIHTVKQRGETLFSIALWYTGSGSNWHSLVDANPNLQPNKIRVGDTIQIPADLVKKRDPMPDGYLKSKSLKKRPAHSPAQPPPVAQPEPETVPLYGPIGNDSPTDPDENTGLPVPLETID